MKLGSHIFFVEYAQLCTPEEFTTTLEPVLLFRNKHFPK